MEKKIIDLNKLLKQSKKLSIITHYNPDGDAIGSSLAIYHYFKRLGLNSNVITPNIHPSFLNWIPGIDQINIYEKDPLKSSKIISELSIIVIFICSLKFKAFKKA